MFGMAECRKVKRKENNERLTKGGQYGNWADMGKCKYPLSRKMSPSFLSLDVWKEPWGSTEIEPELQRMGQGKGSQMKITPDRLRHWCANAEHLGMGPTSLDVLGAVGEEGM